MKRYFLMIFCILGYGILITPVIAWGPDAGNPLYARILLSRDYVHWTHNTLTVCSGEKVYMKAVDSNDQDASNDDLDTLDDKDKLDTVDYYWNFGDGSGGVTANETNHTYTTVGNTYVILTAKDAAIWFDDPDVTDNVLIEVVQPVSCAVNTTKRKELGCQLPGVGRFTAGTTFWTIDTTPGGTLVSYANATEGWVGLQVTSSGGTATIKSYDGTNNSYIDLSSPDVIPDEISICIDMRVTPFLAGTFRVTLYSPNTAQSLVLESTLGSEAGNPVSLLQSGNFERISLLLTPIAQDFTRIKNLELSYSVPAGATNQTTEVIINQIYLAAVRVTP